VIPAPLTITLLKQKRSLINNLCFQRTNGLFLASLLSKKDQPFEYCLYIFHFTYLNNFVNFYFYKYRVKTKKSAVGKRK